jgi:hypothetical protein
MMYIILACVMTQYGIWGATPQAVPAGEVVMSAPAAKSPSKKDKKAITYVWSESAVLELKDMLQITQDDVFAVIHDDADLVLQLYHQTPAHLTLALIADQKKCTEVKQRAAEAVADREDAARDWRDKQAEEIPEKLLRVFCGKPESLSWEGATAAYLSLAEDTSESVIKKISQHIANMPDGVRVASTIPLTENIPSLRLESTQTILPSSTEEILVHVYTVKRPTPAELLEELYCGVNGFSISSGETDLICKGGGNATYGEILFDSAEKLFTEIIPLGENDVFYDLGSGIGKLVLWVYLATPAKKSVGVELSKTRTNHAKTMLQKTQKELAPQFKDQWINAWGNAALKKTVEFRHENILEADLSDATVIFICATCFPESCMQALSEKFATLKEGLQIASLKELPRNPSLKRKSSHTLPMTWSRQNGSEVIIYTVERPKLVDVIPLVISDASTTEPGACQVKEDTDQRLFVHETELYNPQIIRDALKVDGATAFVQVGVQDGTTVLQAYLESESPEVLGVTLSPSIYSYTERLKKSLKEWLAEDPYKKLWKEKWGTKGDKRALSFYNASSNFEKMIPEIAQKVSGRKLALLITATSNDIDLWKLISEQCAALPEGTRIATLKKFEKHNQLAEKEALTMFTGMDVHGEGGRHDPLYFVYEVKSPSKPNPEVDKKIKAEKKEAKKS